MVLWVIAISLAIKALVSVIGLVDVIMDLVWQKKHFPKFYDEENLF